MSCSEKIVSIPDKVSMLDWVDWTGSGSTCPSIKRKWSLDH